MAALHEGIRILDEDEQQRTTLWNDENVVELDIDDEASQEEEEEQQKEDQSLADRGRKRKTTTTQTLGESGRRSSPPPPTRPTPRTSETVGESSKRSPPPPLTRPSSYGYSPLPPLTQPDAHMFLPRTPSMSIHPYHFDPYAPGPSSSYMDHRMPTHSMHGSLPQYMPSPFTPPYYNYNIPYSGDGSFRPLLGMPPHVPFTLPHTGSQYVGMVQPPIFDSTGSRGQSSQHEEKVQSSHRAQQTQPDVQARRNPHRNRVRPVCHTEEQRRRR
ncbi:hypothetical protein Sjap_008833 [Stephania japonica]|uniref:Uncharacterized protein n=1 Tax=Stephania japonica TaxID=461633 RepID=A0AAP0JQU2_9MAGN